MNKNEQRKAAEYLFDNTTLQVTTLVAPDQEDGLPACPAGRVPSHRFCMLCAVYPPHRQSRSFSINPILPQGLAIDTGVVRAVGSRAGTGRDAYPPDLGQPIETYSPYGSASKGRTLFQCTLPDGNEGPGVSVRLRGAGYRRRNLQPEVYA